MPIPIDLTGRAALVTGGSRGIGRGIALCLARAGADVAVNYRKDTDAAQQTVRDIEAVGRRAIAVQADVSDRDAVQHMVVEVAQRLGKLDILVNNAGMASRGDPIGKVDPSEMQRVFGAHVFGAFHCVQAALPHLRKNPRADIHFISSLGALRMPPNYFPYGPAKAAMEGMARILGKEELRNNIRVNVIACGLVKTDMGRRLVKAVAGADIDALDKTYPFGRVCTPEDVGNLSAFLCSETGGYISGHVINLDGGGPQTEISSKGW